MIDMIETHYLRLYRDKKNGPPFGGPFFYPVIAYGKTVASLASSASPRKPCAMITP